ncbi:hypothetical protein AAVH_40683, partial [Aphelenchoides avenae]
EKKTGRKSAASAARSSLLTPEDQPSSDAEGRAPSSARRKRTPKVVQDASSPPSRTRAGAARQQPNKYLQKTRTNLLKRAKENLAQKARIAEKKQRAQTARSQVSPIRARNRTGAEPVSSSVVKASSTAISRALPSPLASPVRKHSSPLKSPPPAAQSDVARTWKIPKEEEEMFHKAREAVRKRLDKAAVEMAEHIENESKAFPPKIRIGRYEIETWYSAPYPQ